MVLSGKMRECLVYFALRVDGDGWGHASGTLTSLRKRGLLERFRADHPHGESRWRITPLGRRVANLSGYYVSAVDGGCHALVAGPYATHAEALARVEVTCREWERRDPRASFAAWGTCRVGVVGPCGCAEPHEVVATK